MNVVKQMVRSKKFWAALAALATAAGAGASKAQPWNVVIIEAISIIGTYVAAQGVADAGKEKAKVEKEG